MLDLNVCPCYLFVTFIRSIIFEILALYIDKYESVSCVSLRTYFNLLLDLLMQMKDKITWTLLPFSELSTSQLYDILYLRNLVFGVEQNDVYLDVDYKDQEALHLLGFIEQKLVAYCRIFPPSAVDAFAKIGRVVIGSDYRQYGLGRLLMREVLTIVDEILKIDEIHIAAQTYLLSFYESFGFVAVGEPYMDGTIEHINMVRSVNK